MSVQSMQASEQELAAIREWFLSLSTTEMRDIAHYSQGLRMSISPLERAVGSLAQYGGCRILHDKWDGAVEAESAR